jgi:hypothetical protein
MDADQDQWTALVVAVMVAACGIGCCVFNIVNRMQTEVYELEEDVEA